MKIDYLKIENFKGVDGLNIYFQRSNAIISGQNGTGKTTVLDAVCWLLTNKMSDRKTAESANYHNSTKTTIVEMKIDGITLRRECNGKSLYYVCGTQYSATDFKISVSGIFKNAIPTLLTPFNFYRMHYSERRNILLNLFAKDIVVDTAEFADIAEDLEQLSPEQILKRETQMQKKIDKELTEIPARISELQNQEFVTIDAAEVQAKIEDLNEKIADKLEEIKQMQSVTKTKFEPFNQSIKLESDALKLEDKVNELRANYVSNDVTLKRLREEFATIKAAMSGTCPTCGNKVPAANLDKLQARLDEIIAQGKEIAEKQELLKKGAEVSKTKAAELHAQAEKLKAQFESDDEKANATEKLNNALIERDELQEELSQAKMKLAESQRAIANKKRLDELKAREIELGVAKSKCDKKIYLAVSYIRRKIELTEQTINSQFEFVQFKMFESYKVAEGVKECCEPMMNGVPYAALSKGEQLKASLDILNTLQKAYGVELPVFIDDAESYTSNSFVNLPNQVILLKAVEGIKKLQIDSKKLPISENLFEGRMSA